MSKQNKDHDPNTAVKPPAVPQGRTLTPQSGGGSGEGTSWAFPTDGGNVRLPGGIPRDAGAGRMQGSAGELARRTDAKAKALEQRVRQGVSEYLDGEGRRSA
jgi:hypothetical protein